MALNWETISATVGLLVLLVAGFVAIAKVKKWRDEPFVEPLDPETEIESYRALVEAGELKAEEFEKIRAKLEGRPTPAEPSAETRHGIQKLDS